MAVLLIPPFYVAVDGNGLAMAGAKLYFYTTGTSTPLDTYTTSALSTPNANPVIADANGMFGPIYAGTTSDYKVILKTSADVTVGTWDPVPRNPALEVLTTKGDLLTYTTTQARKGVGSNGTVLMARSADSTGLAYVAALNGAIYGLTYANNGSDATNDIDIAAGGCMDATGAYWMTASALTKRSDAAWAVGTGNGWLDTGAIGNNAYYIWTIARSDTGVVDSLLSTSSTSPTMPSSYDYKRLTGWIKRVGGTIVAFSTYELEGGGLAYRWTAPTLDVNLANTLTTSRRTDALKVPLNFATDAIFVAIVSDASSASQTRICCPDETDAAPDHTTACLPTHWADTGEVAAQMMRVRTSATGTIAARSNLATVDLYNVATIGFDWSRR